MYRCLVVFVVGPYARRRDVNRWLQRGQDDARPIVPLNLDLLLRRDSRMIHDGAIVVHPLLDVVAIVNQQVRGPAAASAAAVVVGH